MVECWILWNYHPYKTWRRQSFSRVIYLLLAFMYIKNAWSFIQFHLWEDGIHSSIHPFIHSLLLHHCHNRIKLPITLNWGSVGEERKRNLTKFDPVHYFMTKEDQQQQQERRRCTVYIHFPLCSANKRPFSSAGPTKPPTRIALHKLIKYYDHRF